MIESPPQASEVTLDVLLWARPGAESSLIGYEDQFLGIATGYGGQSCSGPAAAAPGGSRWRSSCCQAAAAR
jgi:hypothetical protein